MTPTQRRLARFTADDETAISICRTTYEGDCRCERNGAVICDPMLRQVAEMKPHLEKMRAAFAGQYPEDFPE
jgi:hypothetical protein